MNVITHLLYDSHGQARKLIQRLERRAVWRDREIAEFSRRAAGLARLAAMAWDIRNAHPLPSPAWESIFTEQNAGFRFLHHGPDRCSATCCLKTYLTDAAQCQYG
jgi:hypothetical protein